MTDSATPLSAHDIEQMLRLDIQTCDTLASLLDRELQMLNGRKSDDLQTLIDEKVTLMQKLENSARRRATWSRAIADDALDSQAQTEQMERQWFQFLRGFGSPDLETLWLELQDRVSECKRRNEKNGRIIARGQSTLKQLLSILRGQYVETPQLYTAKGGTRSQGDSHTVIKV